MARGGGGRANPVSSLSTAVNAQSHGFLPDASATDNDRAITEAIGQAIELDLPLVIPGATSPYKISDTIDARGDGVHILGAGSSSTRIAQTTPDTPILQVGGQHVEVSGLQLYYETISSTSDTNANAIEAYDLYFSRLCDLQITYAGRGIFTPSTGSSNAFFSNLVENVSMYGTSISPLWILGYNIGDTGSVFNNIHIGYSNVTPGVSGTSVGPLVYFESMSGSVVNQLNIEHTKVTTTSSFPVQFRACSQLIVNGLYFEGIEPSRDAGALIGVNSPGGGSSVTINGLTCVTGKFLSANGVTNSYAMVNIDDASKVIVNGFSASGNTKTSPFMTFFNGAHASTKQAWVRPPYSNGSTFIEDIEFFTGTDPQFPIVREYDGTFYYWKEGGKNVITGTAAPASGTWAVGDRVINTAPSSGGPSEWRCTTAGTPGTWRALTLAAS